MKKLSGKLNLCRKRRDTDKAQATIEMTFGIIGCFLLFLLTVQLFVWISRVIIERNKVYEDSRLKAGGYDLSGQTDPGAAFQDNDPSTPLWTPPKFMPD
ncbi:MAG: hypothetical protein V1674_06600 [Candidatus Omnitrophota bacterium]